MLKLQGRKWASAGCPLIAAALFLNTFNLWAQSAYIRVNQVGYEIGKAPLRAYLMSPIDESGAAFTVLDANKNSVYSAAVSEQVGNWATCLSGVRAVGNRKCPASIVYKVYALDFSVVRPGIFTISVGGPAASISPPFAVNEPHVLYPGLLLNSLFFYETQRDGPDFIPNALRDKPGHLKDEHGSVYFTPSFDSNDLITSTGMPLTPTGGVINATGGWWDAGDYMKYVETMSYTVALMEIGIRDFPNQMGPNARKHPPAPPAAVSYAGNTVGSPASADFTAEAQFGVDWLMKMWDDKSQTLYYQTDNSQDWVHYPTLIGEYDIWTLPQAADHFRQQGDPEACDPQTTYFICNRPVFLAGAAGSRISPNLAGRLAAAFAEYYQLNRTLRPFEAKQALLSAEHIFALAGTARPDPSNNLLTIAPFDGYPETVWDDDMELGATELFFALRLAGSRDLPSGLPVTNPMVYLRHAAQFAANYITRVYNTGNADTLNLYDVSGLAHFELYRALAIAGNPDELAVSQSILSDAIRTQVDAAITQSQADAFGFGIDWSNGDTTSHGAGLAVMASEAHNLTHARTYDDYSQQWLGNILGANSWGSSFIVGDGTTFPNCIQHQVANLAGALNGTSGGTPILWGAASEGPSSAPSSGIVGGMILCPKNGLDTFAIFNGVDGAQAQRQQAVYRDNMQSYTTTEPAIDLTATSFLMFSWRLAQHPVAWTRITLGANPSTLTSNGEIMLTAEVQSLGTTAPTGTVQFHLGSPSGPLLGNVTLTPLSGPVSIATLDLSNKDLVPGTNEVTAVFPGDGAIDGPSTSLPVDVIVKE